MERAARKMTCNLNTSIKVIIESLKEHGKILVENQGDCFPGEKIGIQVREWMEVTAGSKIKKIIRRSHQELQAKAEFDIKDDQGSMTLPGHKRRMGDG